MKILSVKFRNLNSLEGENMIDLSASPIADTGLFAITGDTGAGKSTILDAITLALYGRMHRNKNVVEVMTYGAIEAFAEVVFDVDGEEYMSSWTIWRARKKVDGNMQGPLRKLSKKNDLTKDWEIIAEKIREVDDQVDEITGLDYDRFSRSVLLSQGDFAAFLRASERERSILLEKITGTEIYSQISKGAYERNKLEEQKLANLELQIKSLEILTDDEISDIKDEEKELKKELKEFNSQLKIEQEQHKAVEQIALLEKNIIVNKNEIDNWQEEKDEIQEELERHELHLKTRKVHDKVLERRRILSESENSLNSIYKAKEENNQLLSKKTIAENAWKVASQLLVELKNGRKNFFDNIDKAIHLDAEIETRKEALIPKQDEWKIINQEFKEKSKIKEEQEKEIQENEQLHQELEKWCKNHKKDEELREDLPKIENPLQDIQEDSIKKNNLEKELEQISQQTTVLEKQLNLISKENSSLLLAVQSLKKKYAEKDPDDENFSGQSLSKILQNEVEVLIILQKELENLADINREYKKELRELNRHEEKWEHLLIEEEQMFTDLLYCKDELEGIVRKAQFKKSIYEQQKALKNYELERNSLEEGAACPLCLSTEHPFRHQHFEAMPDLAKEELNKAEKDLDYFQKIYDDKKIALELIANRKENLMGDGKEIAGQTSDVFKKMQEYEEKIAHIVSSIGKDGLNMVQSNIIQAKIKEISEQIKFKKSTQNSIQDLAQKIQSSADQIQYSQNQSKEKEFEIRRLKDDKKRVQEDITELDKEINSNLKDIQVYLKKYKLDKNTNLDDIYPKLKSRKDAFISKHEHKEQLREQLLLIRKENEAISNTIQELESRKKKIEVDGKKERDEINELQEERYTYLAKELQPETERKKFQAQLASEEEKENTAQQSLQLQSISLEKNSTRLNSLEKNRSTLLKKLDKLVEQLNQYIQKENIPSLDDLDACIMNEEELSFIEGKEKALNERFTRLKQSQESLQANLEKLLDETDEDLDINILEKSIAEKTLEIDSIKETLGRYKERLEKNDERRKSSQDLTKAVTKQKKECLRWFKLNELIGQHDGKKFRVFAQGLTLQRLTQLANQHLLNLNERYQIHKPQDRDLELEIIDTHQANHIRSVNTLSGGESFLVSLALALGLSDLAGRNTQIGSLFIDEGFGTLDNDTLEVALQTLEKLQNTGKTIGVISHIQQLKERIHIQIQVSKKGNGYSQLRITN